MAGGILGIIAIIHGGVIHISIARIGILAGVGEDFMLVGGMILGIMTHGIILGAGDGLATGVATIITIIMDIIMLMDVQVYVMDEIVMPHGEGLMAVPWAVADTAIVLQ